MKATAFGPARHLPGQDAPVWEGGSHTFPITPSPSERGCPDIWELLAHLTLEIIIINNKINGCHLLNPMLNASYVVHLIIICLTDEETILVEPLAQGLLIGKGRAGTQNQICGTPTSGFPLFHCLAKETQAPIVATGPN